MKFAAAIPIFDEWRFMPAVVGQLLKVCSEVVILHGKGSLSGRPALRPPPPSGPWFESENAMKISIVEGHWFDEAETRNVGMELLSDRCDYVFTVDSDELFSDNALKYLTDFATAKEPRAIAGGFHTYWKTAQYRIDPPEKLIAPVLVKNYVRFKYLRQIQGEMTVVPHYLFHHLSYVRTDEEVLAKIQNFGHAKEVVPNWYENVWKKWDENPKLENLHPTHPPAYKRAIIAEDRAARDILERYGVK